MAGTPLGLDQTDLSVEEVTKRYDSGDTTLEVLQGVSLRLEPGETLAVLGASGSGKSTLLNIIGSLDKPTSGRVMLQGKEVSSLRGAALAEFRSTMIGFVFQDHHLLPQCTALENVLVPTLAVGREAGDSDRARSLLERVGLGERTGHLPGRLSGGERQRVAIARAMINSPSLMLCDEPTGNLDRDTGQTVADLFIELAREHEMMLLTMTHDTDLADRFGRRCRLEGGRLSEVD